MHHNHYKSQKPSTMLLRSAAMNNCLWLRTVCAAFYDSQGDPTTTSPACLGEVDKEEQKDAVGKNHTETK